LDRKFNKDFKNVNILLKTVILLLQIRQPILSLTVKLVLKILVPVFDTKRVSEIYDSYFDSGHVTA